MFLRGKVHFSRFVSRPVSVVPAAGFQYEQDSM
jgi:hypothetical protein